jgi:hypothetical protein
MRTFLVALAAILSLAGFVVASAGTSGGGSSGGGGGAGAGSSGAAGGAGSGHGGGGGAAAHGGGGGGVFGAGGHFAGYAAHGGYVAHGAYGARGGYGIVGRDSAGLGHSALGTLAVGPRTGSAAKATRMTRQVAAPPKRPRSKYYPFAYSQCGFQEQLCAGENSLFAPYFCLPDDELRCPQAMKTRMIPVR